MAGSVLAIGGLPGEKEGEDLRGEQRSSCCDSSLLRVFVCTGTTATLGGKTSPVQIITK